MLQFQSSQHLAQCIRYFSLSPNSRSHLEQIWVITAFWEPAATTSGSGGGISRQGVRSAARGGGGRTMRQDVTSSAMSRDLFPT